MALAGIRDGLTWIRSAEISSLRKARFCLSLSTKAKSGQTGKLTQNEYKNIFPVGLPNTFVKQIEVNGEAHWLVRQPASIINTAIEECIAKDYAHIPRYLLYGPTGCGKSTVMAQVIQNCYRLGWAVIHVPNVFDWTHSKYDTRPSATQDDLVDQPFEATNWMKRLVSVNHRHTSTLQLSQSHTWSKQERSLAGDKLEDAVKFGLVKSRLSTPIVSVVLDEIFKPENGIKVLLAIDGVNGLYSPTSMKNNKGEWATTSQLSLPNMILNLINSKLPTAVVVSVSRRGMKRNKTPSCVPELLLGEEGTVALQAFDWLSVPPYKPGEFNNCIKMYQDIRWIGQDFDKSKSQQLWYLTSGIPAEVSKALYYL